MTLRLIDDSMAANPEPPDLNQRRRGRADKGEGYFKAVWVEGRPPNAPTAPSKVCRECHEPQQILHHDPRTNRPEREICGACQGRLNRERMPAPMGGAR